MKKFLGAIIGLLLCIQLSYAWYESPATGDWGTYFEYSDTDFSVVISSNLKVEGNVVYTGTATAPGADYEFLISKDGAITGTGSAIYTDANGDLYCDDIHLSDNVFLGLGSSGDFNIYWNTSGNDHLIAYGPCGGTVSQSGIWMFSGTNDIEAPTGDDLYDHLVFRIRGKNSSMVQFRSDGNYAYIEVEDTNYGVNIATHTVTYSVTVSTASSADLQGITPVAIGQIYMHSSSPGICVATGTALGQWGYIPTQALP